MGAIRHANLGTIFRWSHHYNNNRTQKFFRFLFWSFEPSILGFRYCRPIISIDETHLRGSYKGVLLIASSWDANNHIFPIAFAIVDEESSASYNWFMRLLREHVLKERLISDRCKGILNAMSQ